MIHSYSTVLSYVFFFQLQRLLVGASSYYFLFLQGHFFDKFFFVGIAVISFQDLSLNSNF